MYNIAHRIALFTVEVVFLLIFIYLLKRQVRLTNFVVIIIMILYNI